MFKTELKYIEEKLEELLPEGGDLFDAARYSLLSPGKRLRPLLTLVTAQELGAPIDKAVSPACAIEMIHTYSLIHDDLPCMDDDDWRRGKPSLHKVYGEAHALLTGDFLLTYAFQVLSESPGLTAEQKVAMIQLLSLRSGDQGMIGGQVIDMAAQTQEIDFQTLQKMHLGKTAALITASFEFGGIIAQATQEDMHLLSKAGSTLGLAFQIIDDLLDSEKEYGESINVITHLGREKAQELADELYEKAQHQLSMLSFPVTRLEALAEKLVCRKN